MQKLVNQSSSFANQLYYGGIEATGTTTTGLNTDGRPSGAVLSGSGAHNEGAGTTTLRDSGTMQGHPGLAHQFSGTGGARTSFGATRTVSGDTRRPSVMENWKSAHKKIIWKEILKHKEELNLSEGEHISRTVIKTIRNKIRRERRKRAKKEGFGSQKFLMSDTTKHDSNLMSRRVTGQGYGYQSSLTPIMTQAENMKT